MTGRMRISRRGALAAGAGAVALASRPSWASTPSEGDAIDPIVERFRSVFQIPGIGIAVVRVDADPWLKGYGVRRLGEPAPVDADTLFAIASNSKSFVAAALAMLV